VQGSSKQASGYQVVFWEELAEGCLCALPQSLVDAPGTPSLNFTTPEACQHPPNMVTEPHDS
jgi:hypothetical protein